MGRLLIVSNRLPVTVHRRRGQLQFEQSAGGLATGLSSFYRAYDALWIGWPGIERKNTMSQFHVGSGVGKTKVASLSKTMQFLWGFRDMEIVPHRLTADNIDQLLNIYDVVVDCLDNAESRDLLTQYGWDREGAGAGILHGALAPDGGFGRVVWNDDFQSDGAVSGAATCEDGEHLPFIAITAAYIARAVQIYLREGKQVGYQILPTGQVVVV